MAERKIGHYLDGSVTKSILVEYTDDDLVLTEAINASKTVTALEKQIALYAQEIETMKKSVQTTKRTAIVTAIVSILSIIATIICTVISNRNSVSHGQEIQMLKETSQYVICEDIVKFLFVNNFDCF